MPLLQDCSTQDLKRLLGSFPLSTLKLGWPNVRGTKEEICFAAAQERDQDKLVNFMITNFGRCKQHTYILSPSANEPNPFVAVPDAEILAQDAHGRVMAITKAVFSIFLRDPLEESTVEFLWPMRHGAYGDYLVLSFIVLERNPCVYFDRDCFQSARSIDERGILQNLERAGFTRVDLHKGVKALWENGFMDSCRTRYKKPLSVASEAMDEELGIREHNPELYEQLQTATLFATLFQVHPDRGCEVDQFQVDPSQGYIAFPRYTEGAGDSDEVVNRILEGNL
jgi:hypothetical protein